MDGYLCIVGDVTVGADIYEIMPLLGVMNC